MKFPSKLKVVSKKYKKGSQIKLARREYNKPNPKYRSIGIFYEVTEILLFIYLPNWLMYYL